MNSLTEENYLKALYNLANSKGETTVNELSRKLAIKMPTVNSMMKKLAEKKLVKYQAYKPVTLTEKGRKEAALIIRKHRLTEMFLVVEMGFGWEAVHDIAEQIEHIQSPVFFEKMDELLGYPTIDPHGSPIPDKEGNVKGLPYQKLSLCRPGDKVILHAVIHSEDPFLKFLNSREIKLGVKMEILQVEPFDQSMVVRFNNHRETLSHTVCERLLVAK